MRPPEFTGGNRQRAVCVRPAEQRFNEAAGIHRRKRLGVKRCLSQAVTGFNEAAGIHRRKPMRAPTSAAASLNASMRPPEFTGGNLFAGS